MGNKVRNFGQTLAQLRTKSQHKKRHKFKVISSQFTLSQVQASSGKKDRLSMLIPTKLSGGGATTHVRGRIRNTITASANSTIPSLARKFGRNVRIWLTAKTKGNALVMPTRWQTWFMNFLAAARVTSKRTLNMPPGKRRNCSA